MIEKIAEIEEYLKNNLSEGRANHCIRTMQMCEKMAKIYGADVEKAKLAGLAHDIAKEFTDEENLKYVEENGIEIDDIERRNLKLIHGKLGADICKKKFGFDEEMQDAIMYHTIGKENMSLLTKIVFISDLIEEGRSFSDVEYIRNLAYKNLNKAILYALDKAIKKCVEKEKVIHINTILARNYLLK